MCEADVKSPMRKRKKGIPLPSLPGDSLARQIPTTGIKQVNPPCLGVKLDEARLPARLRRSGTGIGSHTVSLVDRLALDEARLPARLRRSGRLA